jgi:hypothetical protein
VRTYAQATITHQLSDKIIFAGFSLRESSRDEDVCIPPRQEEQQRVLLRR